MDPREGREFLHRVDPYVSRGKDVRVSISDYWEITDVLLDQYLSR